MRATGKAIILGLALAVTPLFGGCSSHSKNDSAKQSENIGELGLQLQVGDLTVNSVSYTLTNGTNTYTGTLDVSEAGTLTAVIGSVQQGSGYNLSLTASATDGSPCLGSAGPFTVTANQTVTVGIELRCTKARTKGSVLIDGTVNECPDISSVIGDPPNGCNVPIHVVATDDGKPTPPGTLTYTWTGATGLAGANPVLNCQASGPVALNVVVSDGDTKAGCDAPFAVTVICPPGCPTTPASCTDGIQNQGETDVDCGGATNTCAKCPSGKHCGVSADCLGGLVCSGGVCGAAPTCADGIQNQGETGVDCGGPCPACLVTTCTAPLHDSTTCTGCEANNCPNDPAGCAAGTCVSQPACSDYQTQAQRDACTAVLNCVRTTNCTAGGPLSCYCGTADATACNSTVAPNANGVCKSVIETGFGSTAPSFIRGNLLVVSFPAGGALNLAQCDHDFCGNGSGNDCVPFCK